MSGCSTLIPTRAEWRWLLLLAGMGLALRLALIAGARTNIIAPKDDHYLFAHEYGRIASSLALGHGYGSPFDRGRGGPTVVGAPLFPFFLSLLFRLFGVYSSGAAAALLASNSVVSVATLPLVFALGKRLFGAAVGWVAAVIFCFDPTPVWYSVNCTWETVYSGAALTLAPLLFLWVEEHSTARRGALAGAVIGVLAHLNAAIVAVSAALGLWLVLRSAGRRASMLRAVGAMAAAAALCTLPWSVRNSLLVGHPMFLRGGGEAVMYVGNHPGATGDVRIDDEQAYAVHNATERSLYYALGEGAYFQYCRDRALAFIKSEPMAYAKLVARRTVVFWLGDLWTRADWQGGLHLGFSLVLAKKVLGLLPIPLAIAGLAIALRRRWPVWPLVCQLVAFALPYMLVYCGVSRYRVPVHASLVLLASVALCAAWPWRASTPLRGREERPA